MTKRTLDAFTNASTGLFADNATGDISEGDLRDFTETSFAGLYSGAAATTDGDITGTVGSMTVWDISGLTADADFILPATCAVGDRVGLMISTGDDAYEIDLHTPSASTDTINGVDSSVGTASWSRVFITGEVVIFRCVVANSAWIVEYDGRIPCKCQLSRESTAQNIANTTDTKIAFDTKSVDVGDVGDIVTNDRVDIRRTGSYALTGQTSLGNLDDSDYLYARVKVDGTLVCWFPYTIAAGSNSTYSVPVPSRMMEISDGSYVELWLYHTEGAAQDTLTGEHNKCRLEVTEIL